MSGHAPRVSVCIPVYNGARHLRACLDSVLAQTHAAAEILIVDDGSTDDSALVIDAYRARSDRVRVVRNDRNLGLVGNWNRCVDLAAHDWIKFVFQDDLIEPTCVERLLAHARDPAVLVVCRRDFIFEPSTSDEQRAIYRAHQRRVDGFFTGRDFVGAAECRAFAIDRFGHNPFGEPTAVLLHKSFFARFGRFRQGLVMSCDLEYWLRVSIHTGAFFVDETLARFRVHGEATSAENHRIRRYRTSRLDNLLLLRAFVDDEAYRPLRVHAAERDLPVDLRACLRLNRQKAYAMADWARRDADRPDPGAMAELLAFYEEFPDLRLNRLGHLLWRLRVRLAGGSTR